MCEYPDILIETRTLNPFICVVFTRFEHCYDACFVKGIQCNQNPPCYTFPFIIFTNYRSATSMSVIFPPSQYVVTLDCSFRISVIVKIYFFPSSVK